MLSMYKIALIKLVAYLQYHQNFKAVIDMEEDVDDLCLSFDVRKTVFGAPITIPLKPVC